MKCFLLTFVLGWVTPLLLIAQQPDLAIDFFYPIGQATAVSDHGASALVYSDGDALAFYIEVKDPQVQIRRENNLTDQVRIWLALPQSAYPTNFEYRFHPDYVCARPQRRSVEPGPRYFSIQGDAASQVEVNSFVTQYDYPNQVGARRMDSLWVPPVNQLSQEAVQYGMVEMVFYPDNRNAQILNLPQLGLVETSLDIQMGPLEQGVIYKAEPTENNDGYVLNIQLSPEALGFVQLPYMKRVRVLMEVVSAPYPGAQPEPILTSKAYSHPPYPSTFDLVSFSQPLRTNFTEIPDDLFFAAQYFPVYAFSQMGWMPTIVDVDALMYHPRALSQSLTEMQISRPVVSYDTWDFEGNRIDRLTIKRTFVNKRAEVEEFTRVNDQLFRAKRVRMESTDPMMPDSGMFFLPDKSMGLILKNSRYLDPYGWADFPEAQEELIEFYRIEGNQRQLIIDILQQDGPSPFCKIGYERFDGFYLLFMEWIDQGKRVVFYLNHHETKEAKRVIARWDRHGERLEIIETE